MLSPESAGLWVMTNSGELPGERQAPGSSSLLNALRSFELWGGQASDPANPALGSC